MASDTRARLTRYHPPFYRTQRFRHRLVTVVAWMMLLVGGIFTVFPFAWMLSTSFKDQKFVMQVPPQWIPDPVVWANYVDIWNIVPLANGFVNSTLVAVVGTLGVLFASSLAGYAFAKLDFPGRDKLFLGALVTMMIPGAVLLIPQFILFKSLGWVDTLLPLIVPSLFGATYETFFFRQYFRGIPDELIDAAKMDGSGFFRIYGGIMVPLSKPVFATMGILGFMGRWNDYMGPLIYLHHIDRQTLPVMIATFQSQYTSDYPHMMAVSVLSMLPIILVFLFAQDFFVEGITMTGLKS